MNICELVFHFICMIMHLVSLFQPDFMQSSIVAYKRSQNFVYNIYLRETLYKPSNISGLCYSDLWMSAYIGLPSLQFCKGTAVISIDTANTGHKTIIYVEIAYTGGSWRSGPGSNPS